MDEWYGLTMADVRSQEEKIKEELDTVNYLSFDRSLKQIKTIDSFLFCSNGIEANCAVTTTNEVQNICLGYSKNRKIPPLNAFRNIRVVFDATE